MQVRGLVRITKKNNLKNNFMEDTNDWTLETLNIIQNWQKKGFYNGSVKFKNGVKMELALILDNEKCVKMISLLQEEIMASALKLGDMLAKSMPIQIPQSTTES